MVRPGLRACSIIAAFVAPIEASAAFSAMVVFARNFGRKSSTAMWSKSRTIFLAHLRPVSCCCRVTFLCGFAACRCAFR